MSAIDEIAGLVSNQIPGIDWAKLESEGRGGVWNRDYIIEYMVPAYQRASAVRDTLDLEFHFDNQEALKAFSDTASALGAIKAAVNSAVQAGLSVLNPANGLKIDIAVYRYIIATAWHTALFGAALHNDETIQHSGQSDAEIKRHATIVTAMFNTLSFMNSLPGALNPLKKPSAMQAVAPGQAPVLVVTPSAPTDAPPGQSGLGVAPLVLLAIVVVGVAALGCVAWYLIATQDVSQKNSEVAKICEQAQQKGDTALTAQCVATMSNPSANAGTLQIQLFKSILPYLAAGAGIYALIVFAPAIVRSLVAARKEVHA